MGQPPKRNNIARDLRTPKYRKRVELLKDVVRYGRFSERREAACWTLFITGLKVREWGFYCPNGWRHWKLFCSNRGNNSTVGRGCE